MTQWNDFDMELMDALGELPPPAETVAVVTPWREAMYRILWGLTLITFHLEFLYLDYLLPAIGTVLLYLGFRGLRQSNRYFKIGWIASVCKVILFYTNSILLATPLLSETPLVLTIFASLVTPLLYLSLWLGIRKAAKDVGHTTVRQPALWALVWYAALALVAWRCPQPGWIPVLVMTGLYICIFCSLWRVTKELELWGYDVSASPASISAGHFRWLYLGTLAAAVALAAFFSSHISMNFAPAEECRPLPALTELGLPEDVAVQLLPEDLESLKNAVRCDMLDEDHPLYGSDGDNKHSNQIYSFLMPDGSVRVLHLFHPGDEGGLWQCRLKVTGNARLYDLNCRLFYTKDGQRMAASSEFGAPTLESGADFFGMYFEQYAASAAPFSWPLFSNERMVYVIYSADQEANPKTMYDELIYYSTAACPAYPFQQENINYDWAAGASFYYGNGSGLVYKADETSSAKF